MIEAIGTGGGIALTMRDPRFEQRRRQPGARRRLASGEAAQVEIEDAIAAVDLDEALAVDVAPVDGPTVTAISVAARLAAAAERGIAMQARIGAAAVRRLLGADG